MTSLFLLLTIALLLMVAFPSPTAASRKHKHDSTDDGTSSTASDDDDANDHAVLGQDLKNRAFPREGLAELLHGYACVQSHRLCRACRRSLRRAASHKNAAVLRSSLLVLGSAAPSDVFWLPRVCDK